MDDLQGIDVEKIVQQIQARIRECQPAEPSSTILRHPSNGQVTPDLAALQNHSDPYHIRFTSHRKVLGWFVVMLKEGLRRLLTPILEQQLGYNVANIQIIRQLCDHFKEVHQLQITLQGEIKELAVKFDALASQSNALATQHMALRGEVETVGQRQDAALRALREAVVMQLEGLEQRHMQICQTLQDGVMEQIEDLGEHLQKRMAHLQKTVLAQECRIAADMDEAGRRLPQQ